MDRMNQPDRRVIAIVVEATDPDTAKAAVRRLMTDWATPLTGLFYGPVDYMEPSPLNSPGANGLLDSFWQTVRGGYVECIKTILGAVALAQGDSDTLLEDQDFRRACAQVGSLTGGHILIWGPVLDPILTYSEIQALRQGSGGIFNPDDLWVVAVEIDQQ